MRAQLIEQIRHGRHHCGRIDVAAGEPGAILEEPLGQRVTVAPDDTGRDPVVGELVASGVDEITIKRNDPAVGEVFVHFPRAGFAVTPA